MIIILSFSTNALIVSPITSFSKVYSNSTDYLTPQIVGIKYGVPFNYNSTIYEYYDDTFNITTHHILNTLHNISGSNAILYNGYLYGNQQTGTTSTKLSKIDNMNRSKIYNTITLSTSYNNNWIKSYMSLGVYNNKIPAYYSTNLGIFNINNLTDYCAVSLSSLDYLVLSNDNNYIYLLTATAGGSTPDYAIVDYNCNIISVYNVSWMTNSPAIHGDNISNIVLSKNKGFFIGWLSVDKNFDIYTWYKDGSGFEESHILTDINANNFTVSKDVHSCDFDQNNNIYYCVGYKNGNVNNLSLVSMQITDTGLLSNIQYYDDIDYFETPSVDVYNSSSLFLFVINSTIYIKMYDTVGGTYDLWSGTPSSIDEYTGLTCNTAHTTCYDSDSTCLQNNWLYTGVNWSNWLCTNVTYTSGDFYCGSNLTHCSGGCRNSTIINPYGVTYNSGTCVTSGTCVSECFVLGDSYSNGITTYAECQDWNSDGCLEYQTISCSAGLVSFNGHCQAQTYLTDTISNLQFEVQPYTSLNLLGGLYGCPKLTCEFGNGVYNCPVDTCTVSEARNNNLESVSFTESINTLNVKTKSCGGGVGLFELALNLQGVNTSEIVGVDCNYQENKEIATLNTTAYLINGSATFYTQNVGSTNKNYLGLLLDGTDKNFSINMTDGMRNIVSYIINLKVTNNEYAIYWGNGTLLLSGNYPTNTPNIANIKIFNDYTNREQNIMLSMYNGNELIFEKGVTMQLYSDTDATLPYYFILKNYSDNVVINYLIRGKITSGTPSIYKQTYTSNLTDFITGFEKVGCSYFTDGTYTARVYLMEDFLGQFFSYRDLTITKTNIPSTSCGTNTTSTSTDFINNLSKTDKLLIALFTSIGLFGLLILIGFAKSPDKLGVWAFAGALLSSGLLIYFTVIGWMPIGAIVLMVCFAAGIVILLFRKSGGE